MLLKIFCCGEGIKEMLSRKNAEHNRNRCHVQLTLLKPEDRTLRLQSSETSTITLKLASGALSLLWIHFSDSYSLCPGFT